MDIQRHHLKHGVDSHKDSSLAWARVVRTSEIRMARGQARKENMKAEIKGVNQADTGPFLYNIVLVRSGKTIVLSLLAL